MDKICVPSQTDGKSSASLENVHRNRKIELALQKEYLDALKIIRKTSTFLISVVMGYYVMTSEFIVKMSEWEIKPFYNFTYIDRIIDSYLELGIRPFVELGFMPQKLASGDQTVFTGRECHSPKDYDKWSQLIRLLSAILFPATGLMKCGSGLLKYGMNPT